MVSYCKDSDIKDRCTCKVHVTWSIDEFLIETSTTFPYASKNRFRVSSVNRPSILCENCNIDRLDFHTLVEKLWQFDDTTWSVW